MVVLNYEQTEMSKAFVGHLFEQCMINFTRKSYDEKKPRGDVI